MPFQRRSLREWGSLQYEEFAALYENDQFVTLRRYLERRIKSDFIRILASTGLSGDVFFTARSKKPFSVHDKLPRAINGWRTKHSEGMKGPALYDLVRDLVAIRLICIDSSAAADVVRRIVASDTLQVVETCEFYLQARESNRDYADLSRVLEPIFATGLDQRKKDSGYESVHLEVRFFGALDRYQQSQHQLGPIYNRRVEEINVLRSQMSEETAAHIPLVPIEVQIRTFTQHIWARDEQSIIYTPVKSGQHQRENVAVAKQIRTEFGKLKRALSKAEDIRSKIRKLETQRVHRSLRFVGKSYEIDSRTVYFKLPAFEQYADRLRDLDMPLSALKLAKPTTTDRFTGDVQKIAAGIVELCEAIDSRLGENYLEDAAGRLSDEFWGRQRVVLLMIGYLLLFSDANTRRAVLVYLARKTEIDSIFGIGDKVELGQVAPARLYEHILRNDRIVSGKNPKHLYVFQDPLVYSRLASSRYRDEDYCGAAASMNELFSNSWWEAFWRSQQLDSPKAYQFHMRRAEYLWYHGSKIGDRSGFYETIVGDLSHCVDNGGTADGKVLSWTVLLATIIHGKERHKNELARMAAAAEAQLESLAEPERVNVADKYYFVAASAVRALRNRQRTHGFELLNEARAILKRGIPHPKGAIAIGLQMCDEIEAVFASKA